jgi:NTE family protein
LRRSRIPLAERIAFNAVLLKELRMMDFFRLLRDAGRRAAQTFLEVHAEHLGHRSTFDLDGLLEGV